MLCATCGIEWPEDDFYGKMSCYRCIFKEKLANCKDSKKHRRCKECKKSVPKNRWTYCSGECSRIATARKKEEHWTRKFGKLKKKNSDHPWNYTWEHSVPKKSGTDLV